MEFIQQNIYLISIALISGGMLAFMSFRRPAGSNLPESRNIPAGRLQERAGELDRFKEGPLLLICQSGSRSSTASKQLAKLGFARVHCLEGGINAWRTAGLPLKKGAKK